jgi:hypothetical protein
MKKRKIVGERMRKPFVFTLQVQVHNEWKIVKTRNELLNVILKVSKR